MFSSILSKKSRKITVMTVNESMSTVINFRYRLSLLGSVRRAFLHMIIGVCICGLYFIYNIHGISTDI